MKIANPLARRGEDSATRFLQKNGYKIIDRNYRQSYGEIDIIAIDTTEKDHPVLAFIEVKTRKSLQFGSSREAITSWKLRSLIKTAQFYKVAHKNLPESLRIDAVCITIQVDGKEDIELIKNIS